MGYVRLSRLRLLLQQFPVMFLYIIEPKQPSARLTRARLQLGFSSAMSLCEGELGVSGVLMF